MIDTSKLSVEERNSLLISLMADEKKEKEQKKQERKVFKELSEEYVSDNVDFLINHKSITEKLIEDLFEDYATIKELKSKVYGSKKQDSHTSTLADGSASITIGYNVTIGFDGTESVGVEKIKNFINSLAANDENTKKLTKMVNTFLKPNAKTGMLNPAKIIELNKLRGDFEDEEFNEGLDIIFNAQIRNQNSMYVSGWKFVEDNNKKKKMEFRFTV